MVFVTLTAPSFGPVHSRRERRRQGAALPAAARRAEVCRARRPARRAARCTTRTIRGSASRSAPTALTTSTRCCGTRWRRSCGGAPRSRSRASSPAWSASAQRRLRERVRVSYVKVAEYQRRGALHFHVVVRLDAAQPTDGPSWSSRRRPSSRPSCSSDAVARRGRARVGALPHPGRRRLPTRAGAREIRWGRADRGARRSNAAAGAEAASCAGYIAKYATKSTEAVGGLMHRLDAADLAAPARCARTSRRLVECAWELGGEPHLRAAAAAAVGARARVPRALLHQEPPLLDDVHARCARRATSTSCAASTAASRATRGAGR